MRIVIVCVGLIVIPLIWIAGFFVASFFTTGLYFFKEFGKLSEFFQNPAVFENRWFGIVLVSYAAGLGANIVFAILALITQKSARINTIVTSTLSLFLALSVISVIFGWWVLVMSPDMIYGTCYTVCYGQTDRDHIPYAFAGYYFGFSVLLPWISFLIIAMSMANGEKSD